MSLQNPLANKRNKRGRKRNYLEAAVDSSSSQLRICLTLRLKIVADCLTSLLSRRTTALTPATVSMKLVKAMSLCFFNQNAVFPRFRCCCQLQMRGFCLVQSFFSSNMRFPSWAVSGIYRPSISAHL